MKIALVAYLAALRSLARHAPPRGRAATAAVAGEIEKTQQGEAQGAEFRGFALQARDGAGRPRRCRRHVHPRRADRAKARTRALRDDLARLSTSGRSSTRLSRRDGIRENSIVRMRDVLDRVLAPGCRAGRGRDEATATCAELRAMGAIQGGFGWRVSRTPHRTDLVPSISACRLAVGDGGGAGARRSTSPARSTGLRRKST